MRSVPGLLIGGAVLILAASAQAQSIGRGLMRHSAERRRFQETSIATDCRAAISRSRSTA
jgi:hypothetical protein